MSQSTKPDEQHRPSQRRLYIFSVTFLALFLISLLFVPTNVLVYRSQSMLSVESSGVKPLELDEVRNRLVTVTSEMLVDENLSAMIEQIQKVSRDSNLLSSDDYGEIRSAIQIGVKQLKDDHQQIVSVSLVGSGTADERAFVNMISANIVETFQHEEFKNPSIEDIAQLQQDLKLFTARAKGVDNFRAMLLTLHFQRIRSALNPKAIKPDQPKNVQASTASISNNYKINPAWQAFTTRQNELIQMQKQLMQQNNPTSASQLSLATIQEELHWINNQLTIEQRYLPLTSKATKTTVVKPAIAKKSQSDNGPNVRINNPFKQASHKESEKTEVSFDNYLHDGYLTKTYGVLTELDLRTNQINRQRNELVSTANRNLHTAATPDTRFRILQTAQRSNQLNNSINFNQLLWMLIIGGIFAGVITMQSDWRVDGNAFNSSEDVSRKLGVPVLGTLGSSNAATKVRADLIRLSISVCEYVIVGFAVIMLVVAISNNSIGIQMLSDPINGIVNAAKSIW